MPNRILKESICVSDSIAELSWFEEVLFYRLIVSCDDFGRFDGRIPVIKNRLFPLKDNITNKNITEAINKLVSTGLVSLYEVNGKPFLYLSTWNDHQNVRAKRSKYPDPADGNILQASASICKQMNSNASKCSRNPIQSESESLSESNPNPPTALEVAMGEFRQHRKALKKPMNDLSEKKILNELERLSNGDESIKVQIIDQSIRNGWQGVFPLKEDRKRPSQNYEQHHTTEADLSHLLVNLDE